MACAIGFNLSGSLPNSNLSITQPLRLQNKTITKYIKALRKNNKLSIVSQKFLHK
jgi:hypothetical protein